MITTGAVLRRTNQWQPIAQFADARPDPRAARVTESRRVTRERGQPLSSYRTIVVGTDGSQTSFRAVERAGALAAHEDATLVIACAYIPEKPDPHAEDVLGDDAYQVMGSAPADDSVSRARDRAVAAGATNVKTTAVQGKPLDVLQRVVKDFDADLIIVGNRGLNTLAGRLIGSVPLDIARHVPIDVLIVHTT
jgi:nucleotide-binding universal stress UspA family protein